MLVISDRSIDSRNVGSSSLCRQRRRHSSTYRYGLASLITCNIPSSSANTAIIHHTQSKINEATISSLKCNRSVMCINRHREIFLSNKES